MGTPAIDAGISAATQPRNPQPLAATSTLDQGISAALKGSGAETTVQMWDGRYASQERAAAAGAVKDVPASQIEEFKRNNWYGVMSAEGLQKMRAEALRDDPVGNTILTLGGNLLQRAGQKTGEAIVEKLTEKPLQAVAKFTAKPQTVSRVGTGIVDSSGNEIMKDVVETGTSRAAQMASQASSAVSKQAVKALSYGAGTAATYFGLRWLAKQYGL